MIRRFNMPKDFDKLPIGFYLRTGRDGRWKIGGQKSELPAGKGVKPYEILGPIPLRERKMDGFSTLYFDGLMKPLNALTQELKAIA